jgi:hypothetical protein
MSIQEYQRRTDRGTVIYGPNVVSVGEYAANLEILLNQSGLVLSEDIKIVTLIPDPDLNQTIYWENSNGDIDPYDPYSLLMADEYSAKLPASGISIDCTFESLRTISFYAANTTGMTVIQSS